ncbi:MAG: DUF4149 domain-containing protein [Alphaproteobacteria bacterium]|nr:DUF4149 domain-containing protein [Alphaproteobacteria bacterium]MCY4317827.1 DUF4149 domain-containing protein [Alphaproteobacteria bacterium]
MGRPLSAAPYARYIRLMAGIDMVFLGIAVAASALAFGGMVTFSGFFAPMVFRKLDRQVADTFMRDVFGPYYTFMAAVCGIAALAAVAVQPWDAAIMALVSAAFLASRYAAMPRVQKLFDARERGEYGAADEFQRIHKNAAFVNMVQLVAVLAALLRLAL